MRRVACALVGLVVAAACGGSPVIVAQPKQVVHLLPATLETARPNKGDPRALHVRVWADAGIRALPHWREDVTEQIDYASQLLVPLVGARLTIDKIVDWDRTGAPGAALADLVAADDAKGAAWVIGYVTPAYEGVSPVAVGGKPTDDPYPRRAFSTRVTPRSLQGGRQ